MIKLSGSFKPKKSYNFIRLGNKYDGGYLLGNTTIQNSSSLISFGISLDISFEKNFYELTQKKIYMYDRSHYKYYFRDEFLLSLNELRRFKFSKTFNAIKKYFQIKNFTKENIFSVKTITYNSLTNILKTIDDNINILLKIDIEGSEYRVIECLLKNQSKLEGLIIEFHDIDLHEKKIIDFINIFELKLTHTHANNFGITDVNGNPTVLEMTFERDPKIISNEFVIPNKLDNRNNPLKKDFTNYF